MTTLEKMRAEIEQSIPWNTEEKAMKSAVLDVINKYAEQEQTNTKLMLMEANINGYIQGLKDSSKADQEPKICEKCLYADEIDGSHCYECVKGESKFEPRPRTGRWIEKDINEWTHKIYCSECGCPPPFEYVSNGDVYSASGYGVSNKTKYCPSCGARMIESEENK